MSPVARKRGYYVAGLVGAAAAGFGSHWVPAIVHEAPAAVAIPVQAVAPPENPLERRLVAVENAEGKILAELRDIRRIVDYLECRSNVNNVCPPPERGR